MNNTKFFLGANSDIGFKSYFEQLQGQDLQLLILKGGAGSGKSTLMKRVLKFAKEKGHMTEVIPCASDASSLDAVIDHTQKFAIMDGTVPHTLDPDLAGINSHIIYTGDLWDIGKLRNCRKEAEALSREIAKEHKGATAYIRSASALLRENMCFAQNFINKEYADSFVQKITSEAFSVDGGCENIRLLSAVSVGETVIFTDTPSSLCDRIYILNDKWGAAADYIIGKIRYLASEANQDFIYCPCPIMSGKSDHIIFPKRKVAIVTKNDFLSFADGEKIGEDLLYADIPQDFHLQKRLGLALRILPLAEDCVKKAKELHDILEEYYIGAMDFGGMDALFDKILHHFYYQFPQNC